MENISWNSFGCNVTIPEIFSYAERPELSASHHAYLITSSFISCLSSVLTDTPVVSGIRVFLMVTNPQVFYSFPISLKKCVEGIEAVSRH